MFIDKTLTFSVLYTFIVEAGCICYNEKMHYLWMRIGISEQKKRMPLKRKKWVSGMKRIKSLVKKGFIFEQAAIIIESNSCFSFYGAETFFIKETNFFKDNRIKALRYVVYIGLKGTSLFCREG